MRVNEVQKARKPQGACDSCGEKIEAGQAYRYISPRYGSRKARHMTCPMFRASETTSNDKLAALYAVTEQISDYAQDVGSDTLLEDVKSFLSEQAEAVREVVTQYQEVAENIRDGFGHDTFVSEEADSNADEVDTWADEVESAADYVEEWDDELEHTDDEREEWEASVVSALDDASGGCPL